MILATHSLFASATQVVDATSNLFLGTQNDLWSNPLNWSFLHVPDSTEKARIVHYCVLDVTTTVDQLVIDPGYTLYADSTLSRVLTVNSDCTSSGTINFSSGSDGNHHLILKGVNNTLGNLIPGTVTSVTYSRVGAQTIAGTTYSVLKFTETTGTKTLGGHVSMTDLYMGKSGGTGTMNVELGNYNFIQTGSIYFTQAGTKNITRSGTGTTRIGTISENILSVSIGSNDLEWSAGSVGSSIVNITAANVIATQTQTLNSTSQVNVTGNFLVKSTKTFTNAGILKVTGTTNGESGSATLLNNATGVFNFAGTTNAMLTAGVFTQSGSVIYSGTGVQDIQFSSFVNLSIVGTGTKSLTADTTVSSTFNPWAATTTDLKGYNFTVNGGMPYVDSPSKTVTRSINAGLTKITGNINHLGLTFNLGTTEIELAGGGIGTNESNTVTINASKIKATTSNQTWRGSSLVLNAPVEIADNVTVIYFSGISVPTTYNINGLGSNSKLDLRLSWTWSLAAAPMETGIFDASQVSNTFTYNKIGTQNVKGSYYHLYMTTATGSLGTKTAIGNVSTVGNLTIDQHATFDMAAFNLDVGAITDISGTQLTNKGTLAKTGAGSLLFRGLLRLNQQSTRLNFSGNPTIEFRGGTYLKNDATYTWGTGGVSFTTNNQSFGGDVEQLSTFTPTITIVGAIIVTVNVKLLVGGAINGTVAGSTLNNNSGIFLVNDVSIMSTGVFNYKNGGNSTYMGYIFNGDKTLPYTDFGYLIVRGTGTKTLSGNTTVNSNLEINAGGKLECSTYNLTVSGTTTTQSAGKLYKSGAGSLLFVGLCNITTFNDQFIMTGNPTIEFRGGFGSKSDAIFNTGTGNITFSTNNQSFFTSDIQLFHNRYTVANNITISGAITLAYSSGMFKFTGTIDGTVSGSTFNNNLGYLYLVNTTLPMATNGVFNHSNHASSHIGFIMDSDFTIPYTSVKGVIIEGTGNKTLSGDTTITGNLYIQEKGKLLTASNSLTTTGAITITGNNSYSDKATLSKTGSGTILCSGAFNCNSWKNELILGATAILELRGGATLKDDVTYTLTAGSLIKFTTNNQSLSAISAAGLFPVLNSDVLVSGAITVTNNNSALVWSGTWNGDNAASKLDNRATFYYSNAQRPMLTGLLETNLAANTFRYNRNGSQDIKGGDYRTIVLDGTGTPNDKTLQGNITTSSGGYSIAGGSNAVLVLNGYTKTP